MRIVWPFRSLSVARGCARVDSRLDTAKICSNRRVDADRPRLRAVFLGGRKNVFTQPGPGAVIQVAVRRRSWSSSNLPNGSYIVSGSKPERRGRGHAANLDHE